MRAPHPACGRYDHTRTRTRSVKSITEDTRINKALWQLTEEMRKIKAAA
jgi:hypothetical protein